VLAREGNRGLVEIESVDQRPRITLRDTDARPAGTTAEICHPRGIGSGQPRREPGYRRQPLLSELAQKRRPVHARLALAQVFAVVLEGQTSARAERIHDRLQRLHRADRKA
jgi:hypothetical protein